MKILWIIHGYVPSLNAGAEYYAHNLNKYLISKGHKVCVLVPEKYADKTNENTCYEGVNINITDVKAERDALAEWCDIVMTHLDYTEIAMNYINSYKPIVWVSHNTHFDSYKKVGNNANLSIIYNSNAMREMGKDKFMNDSFVLRPPISLKRPLNKKEPNPFNNEYITLINCNKNKGGEILRELAQKMPYKKFLAVTGAYEKQILELTPNVTVEPPTTNIQKIYDKSRIILMPSFYESWGMVASEAIENGIPVIANRTFGLEENLADAGTYCPLDNVKKWIQSIKLLDNKVIYDLKSKQSLERAKEQKLMNKKELRDCEIFLLNKIELFKKTHNINVLD